MQREVGFALTVYNAKSGKDLIMNDLKKELPSAGQGLKKCLAAVLWEIMGGEW